MPSEQDGARPAWQWFRQEQSRTTEDAASVFGFLRLRAKKHAEDDSSQSVFRECRSSAESEGLMPRSLETRMRDGVIASVLVLIAAQTLMTAEPAVMESTKAQEDVAPSTDPTVPFWRGARAVDTDKAPYGQSQPRYRTEILSRWTEKNLYFLFVCPYEVLNLKPSPDSSSETFQLWDWDVAEVFIGSDFKNIRRYREFEISPQGEWVDLDIDLDSPHHEDGWKWNSGFKVSSRIDRAAKVWYGVMQIPYSSVDTRAAAAGNLFRVNFFRAQGAPPNKKSLT